MSRPEHIGPPELFYNESEAVKYTNNTRIIEIQMSMSSRAIELLNLPEDQPSFILDVGYEVEFVSFFLFNLVFVSNCALFRTVRHFCIDCCVIHLPRLTSY